MKTKPEQTGTDKGQITSIAAIIYEDYFVPALFQEWAKRTMEAAKINESDSVLDVGCGTGILARVIKQHVNSGGKIVGLDLNKGMLKVASQKSKGIDWVMGSAEAIPFDNETFDKVVSQFGLMFFTDRRKALQEMKRVLRPQGILAVTVWDSLENNPGYSALVNLLHRNIGENVAKLLRAPFVLGDKEELNLLFEEAGITSASINTVQGKARFPSVRSWIFTDVKGWTMSEMIHDQQIEELITVAEKEFSPFISSDGTVNFAMPAHIVTA